MGGQGAVRGRQTSHLVSRNKKAELCVHTGEGAAKGAEKGEVAVG